MARDSRSLPVVTAEVAGDDGRRTAATDGVLYVRLNDQLCDLERPISIVVNGVRRTPQTVARSFATLATTLDERGDARLAFPTELRLTLALD